MAQKKKNNKGTMLCGRCSATCGNRCLKCPECPYVFKLSAAKGFKQATTTEIREPSPTVLEARIRIKEKYDKLVTAKEVYDDMISYEPCLDLRKKVPTLIIILLVSQILCAQGIFKFPQHNVEYAHVLPADKVDEVLAWEEGLDPKFAVLTPKTRFIGIWWRHASVVS